MVNIITIEREYGCEGDDIAQLPASRLGWKLWDQQLTEEIARLAKCPKAVVEARESGTTVIQLPLRELWRDDGFSTTARRKSLTHKDVKQMLASGPSSSSSQMSARLRAGFRPSHAMI